ncbi:hypothetical protein FF80_02347 [Devosia sp. LC5]|uniref:Spy/CpxP family protein refolding chaperone n=1 Tax=Devosia sp. LC5 TaxID=1502724 RepID=UPI0004E423E6|nr:Spy/CpxP family protein refolding chaperone [Devosia sp. LC5]KFC66960.1 hypothetical protein FF80_02347 [Devosia sp. LC5]
MKTISKPAIVALLTAALGFTSLAPSFAQETGVAAPTAPAAADVQKPGPGHNRFQHKGQFPEGGMRRMELRHGGGFFNFERGAEAAEIGLVRLSHRIDLTAEQQPLFDAMKTAVLAAADDFATAAQAARPATDAEKPDVAARLDARIAITSAHLAALEAIKPSVTAFFDSLTPEQQQALAPERGERPNWGRPGQDGPAQPAQPAPTNG